MTIIMIEKEREKETYAHYKSVKINVEKKRFPIN